MLKTKKIVVSMLLVFALLFTGLGVSSMLPAKATDADIATVKRVSLSPDAYGADKNYITLYLDGVNYTKTNEDIIDNWNLYNEYIFVNGENLVGKVKWSLGAQGGPADRFMLWIKPGVLRFDGTDVVEIKSGAKIPKTTGGDSDYYYINKDYKFVKGNDNLNLIQDITYVADVEIDATWELFKPQEAGGVVDGFTNSGLTFEDVTRWGMTDGQLYANYGPDKFINYELRKPINPAEFDKIVIKIMHNVANAKVGLYPVDATTLSDNAPVEILSKSSVRNVEINIADLLCSDGMFKGFKVVGKAGAGQFFVDSIKLPSPFVYESGKLYDIDFDFIKSPEQATNVNGFTVNPLKAPDPNYAGMTDGSLWGKANATEVAKFEFKYPVDITVFPKATINFLYNIPNSKVAWYPLDSTDFTAEPPILTTGADKYPNKIDVDLSILACKDGKFHGFYIVHKEGDPQWAQFFLDSFTPYSVHTLTINVEGNETTKTLKHTESIVLEEPTKAGYNFKGWFEDADCAIPADITKMPAKDYKIYAGFELIPYVVKISGVSLSTKGDIALNFYASLTPDMLDGTVKITKGTTPLSDINIADVEVKEGFHVFSIPVPAKDMDENINIKFLSKDGVVRAEKNYKVIDYINEILNDPSANFDKEKPLMRELLRYGQYAKSYFKNVDVDEGVVEPTFDESVLSENVVTITGTMPQDMTLIGYSLLLESNTTIRIYFSSVSATLPESTYLVDGVAVVPVNAMKDGGKYQDADGNYIYYIDISNISAKDLGVDKVVTIGGTQITVNAIDYVAKVLSSASSPVKLKNLVKALYLCNVEAVKYFPSKQLEISGFVLPKNIDQHQVDLMKDAGINTIFIAKAGDGVYNFNIAAPSEEDLRTLKLLSDNGIKVYLHIGKDAAKLNEIGKYVHNNNMSGFLLDEPDKNEIAQISAKVNDFNNAGGNKTLYVNMYPSFAEIVNTQYGGSYEAYMTDLYDNVLSRLNGEKILSADRYPIRTTGLDKKWLADVEAVKNFAELNNLKTNYFIQSMALGGVEGREPTYEDMRLQEYSLMAFGYDSISLFCYGTPLTKDTNFKGSALINTDGSVNTPVYNAVSKANNEMIALERILSNFNWQGVFTTKGNMNLKHTLSLSMVEGISSVSSQKDAFVGYFKNNENKEGFLVVNHNDTTSVTSNNVTLNFNSAMAYNKAMVVRGGVASTIDITSNTVTLNLGAGEGIFVVPYKA